MAAGADDRSSAAANVANGIAFSLIVSSPFGKTPVDACRRAGDAWKAL